MDLPLRAIAANRRLISCGTTPSGRLVLVAMNDGTTPQTFNISYAGRLVTHTLDVGSVATYVW